MTAIEDRTRAAMDAITGLVERLPPLPLPPPALPGAPARRRGRVPSARRRWRSWLAPVAAAVAVLAIAITLVVVRDIPGARNRRAAPSVSLAGAAVSIPQYYVTFNQPRDDTTKPVALVLRDTLTGKTLFTLQPPRGLSFAGVTGAADDRTFVADAHRDPYGVQGSAGRSRSWYLVRVSGTGSRIALTMTRLPIPPTPVGTDIVAIALSPDGTKLAVASEPVSDNIDVPQLLRVYSVATGAVLRSWSSAPGLVPPIEGGGGAGGDDNASVAWVGDRALAYYGIAQEAPRKFIGGVWVLKLSHPDGHIIASSRLAVQVPTQGYTARPPFGCNLLFRGDVVVTGDGNLFVCGGSGASSVKLPRLYCLEKPAWNTVAYAGFSLTTGKLTRFLSGYRTGCSGYNVTGYALWANYSGSVVIGYMLFGDASSGRFGAFSDGAFRALPYPVPGNSYQYFNGSLLYQVAW